MSEVLSKVTCDHIPEGDSCGLVVTLIEQNAELREQGARLFDKTLELGTENAKLRELVRSVLVLRHDRVFKWLDAAMAEVFGTSFTAQARELGVEVD